MVEAADLARKGLLPLPGGTLDQTQAFLSACRAVWADEDHWRAKEGGPMAALAVLLGG